MSTQLFIGKLCTLLSRSSKRDDAVRAASIIKQSLEANVSKIAQAYQQAPDGYIIVTGWHTSPSDNTPHWTVDTYVKDAQGVDKPIGAIHVYDEKTLSVFASPRKQAFESYAIAAGLKP